MEYTLRSTDEVHAPTALNAILTSKLQIELQRACLRSLSIPADVCVAILDRRFRIEGAEVVVDVQVADAEREAKRRRKILDAHKETLRALFEESFFLLFDSESTPIEGRSREYFEMRLKVASIAWALAWERLADGKLSMSQLPDLANLLAAFYLEVGV
jgi:hypothetical protein